MEREKKRFKIVRTDGEQQIEWVTSQLSAIADVVNLPESTTTQEELEKECEDADVILHCYTPITRKVIENAKQLKGIVKYGVGIDKIDLDAAKERLIPVVNIPFYGDQTVAEAAFALMISLTRRIKPITNYIEKEGWAWPTCQWLGTDLQGKTIGLIGFGAIAKRFTKMCQGFEMKILAYDPYKPPSEFESQHVKQIKDLSSLLEESDIVVVMAVLTPETYHLIDRKMISKMKSSSILVNTSRGAIVEEEALVDAMLHKKLAGIGIDVFENEPLRKEGHVYSPLLGDERCLFLPHFAFWTREAKDRLERETVQRVLEVLDLEAKVLGLEEFGASGVLEKEKEEKREEENKDGQERRVKVYSHDPRLRSFPPESRMEFMG